MSRPLIIDYLCPYEYPFVRIQGTNVRKVQYVRQRYHNDANPMRISSSNGEVCNEPFIQLWMLVDGVRYVLKSSRNNITPTPPLPEKFSPSG